MIDTAKLQEKIADSGFKLTFIAKRMGLAYQSLYKKIHGVSEFKVSEVKELCLLLQITDPEEREAIFFTFKGENN